MASLTSPSSNFSGWITRIGALREQDPEGRLAVLLAERAKLEPEVARGRVHAEALKLLEAELEGARDRLTAAVGGPIRERVARWVRYLLQDESEVAVGEDGVPTAITSPAGQGVPYDEQSFGTREQVSVLYRLAVADLVAEDAGRGVCLHLITAGVREPLRHIGRHDLVDVQGLRHIQEQPGLRGSGVDAGRARPTPGAIASPTLHDADHAVPAIVIAFGKCLYTSSFIHFKVAIAS